MTVTLADVKRDIKPRNRTDEDLTRDLAYCQARVDRVLSSSVGQAGATVETRYELGARPFIADHEIDSLTSVVDDGETLTGDDYALYRGLVWRLREGRRDVWGDIVTIEYTPKATDDMRDFAVMSLMKILDNTERGVSSSSGSIAGGMDNQASYFAPGREETAILRAIKRRRPLA